jgi:hypothetical protein
LCESRPVFTTEFRDRVREHVLALAEHDPRVVAAAAVGSLADEGDRWSDLDLTFGVDGSVDDVLEEWTRDVVKTFDAAVLFDLPSGPSIYRVLLLPGCLQVDLSFTPANEFGARGPKFSLLFGEVVELPQRPPTEPREILGYAVHHAVRARYCIKRGRLWQAEFWISGVRTDALELACLRHGVEADFGRGRDRLPHRVLEPFEAALVRSIDHEEVLRAWRGAVEALLGEAGQAPELSAQVEPMLRELLSPDEHPW